MAFKINADRYAYSAEPEKVSGSYAAELAKKLVADEAEVRQSEDVSLKNEIDIEASKLTSESALRSEGDRALSERISLEVSKLETADNMLRAQIPSKTSQLINDSGYLIEHQDISLKADKDHTHTGDDITVTAEENEDGFNGGEVISTTDTVANFIQSLCTRVNNLEWYKDQYLFYDIIDLQNKKADKDYVNEELSSIASELNLHSHYGDTIYVDDVMRDPETTTTLNNELSNIATELVNKADKAIIEASEDTSCTFEFSNTHNTEKRFAEVTSISFTFGDGEYAPDYTSGLSFDSGATPTAIDYTDSGILNWVGTDCTMSDGLSIFQPSANTHYDIVFYFNGSQFIGLVNGYVPATGNEAA